MLIEETKAQWRLHSGMLSRQHSQADSDHGPELLHQGHTCFVCVPAHRKLLLSKRALRVLRRELRARADVSCF